MADKNDQSKTMELTASDLEAVRVPRPSSEKAAEPAPEPAAARGAEPEPQPGDTAKRPLPRTVIDGRYELVRCLGSGAMGSVYLVRHVRLKKQFALKMVNPRLARIPEFVSRFEREADACSRLSHPNCISVTDFGQSKDGSLYLVMEYADGHLLSDVIAEGALPLAEAVEYTRQMLLGLRHAHGEGLVHRDIKLENLVVCERDDGLRELKILDFGMAKERLAEERRGPITRDGMVMGTPHYMAPEQVSDAEVDARADLYAVGVTLFRMISGKTVFEGESVIEVFLAKTQNVAPALKDVTGETYPEALEALLARALKRDPADRFSSAGEMLDALEQVALEIPDMPRVTSFTAPLRPMAQAGGGAERAGPAQAVVRSVAAFLTGLREEVARWYACAEQGRAPSWRNRLAGLFRTPSGRIVLVRFAALMTVLVVVAVALLSTPPPGAQRLPSLGRPADLKGDITPRESAASEPAHETSPSQKKARTRAVDDVASVDPALIEAALLIDQKRCRKAVKSLEKSAKKESARALYLFGRVKMCLGETKAALGYYEKAVSKDVGYRTDTRILKDAKRLVANPKRRKEAFGLMAALGKPALPALVHLAERHLQKEVRKEAMSELEKLGAVDLLDLAVPLELDLNQARNCKEKREIVGKLAALGTKTAKGVLIRARDMEIKDGWFKKRYKNECVRMDIIKALTEMRKSRSPEPASAD
jgi:serine/threonine-protein kinase